MRKKITNEEFLNRLEKTNSNIEALEPYVSATKKMRFKCKICGYEWLEYAGNVSRTRINFRCLKCEKNEKFQKALHKVNPNIEPLNEYQGFRTKITVRCKICGYEWQVTPDYALKEHPIIGGHIHCQKCLGRCVDNETFLQKIAKVNPTIRPLEPYVKSKTKIKVECLMCGNKWEVSPNNIVAKNPTQCPECSKREVAENNKFTEEQFLKKMKLLRPDIIVLDKYIGSHSKIRVKSNLCGHEWLAKPSWLWSIKVGEGCPICKVENHIKNRTYTNEQCKEKMEKYRPDLTVISAYNGAMEKIQVTSKICHHTWSAYPYKLWSKPIGKGCVECWRIHQNSLGKKNKLSHVEFVNRMSKIHPKITVLGKYINSDSNIEVKCNICGLQWSPKAASLIHQQSGCPHCCSSKGEKAIANILQQLNVNFISQKSFDDCLYKRKLLFDFYLPDYNMCIEYDGHQHFHPVNFGGCNDTLAQTSFKETQERDRIKDEYCKSHNICLIRIPYWEFKNIEHFLTDKIIMKKGMNKSIGRV